MRYRASGMTALFGTPSFWRRPESILTLNGFKDGFRITCAIARPE
jgi:hypothetical protein